jgi:PAS domain S-box-containing protein
VSALPPLMSLTTFEVLLIGTGLTSVALFHLQRAAARRRLLAAEAERLTAQHRLTALSAFSSDAVLLLDGQGRLLDANERAETMYGWTREELLRLTMRDLRAPVDRESLEGHLHALRRGGELRLETTHARRDGSTFSVEASGKLVGSAADPRFQIIVRDIHARKLAEQARRETEERWRTIATAAHDAIVTIDNQGLVTYWNPAAERLFGYLSGEVLGRNLHAFLVPERYQAPHRAAFPHWQRTGQGGAVGKTIELVALRKDGSEREVELSLASVMVDQRWHAVGVLRDVSARKQADADLRRAKAAAEDARSQLLRANSQLAATAKRARELADQAQTANVAKSDFLANMSHEIRTPMNAIIGMSGLLLDTPLSAEQREQADIIRGSADALLGVINGILDYSKIEAGKIDIEVVDFDLRSLVEDAIDMLAVPAEQKGLQLTSFVAADVPSRLRGDPGRLRQVLVNLVGNAIKFTPAGEVEVSVNWVQRDHEFATIAFRVRDTGVGIPREAIDRLFQSFSQVDASITRRFGGTGLGLVISRRLVNLMGGDISVESEPGSGSTFSFTVRFERQAHGRDDRIALPAGAPRPRVLIVDDHPTNRLVLGEQLKALGCPSVSAPGATAALASLEAAAKRGEPFAVAIIDAAMPDVDGETLAVQISREPLLQGLKLVMFSSRALRGDLDRLRGLGFAAFLAKPLRLIDLRDCLVRVTAPAHAPSLPAPGQAPHCPAPLPGRQLRALVVDDNTVNQKLAVRLLEKLGMRADQVGSGREALSAVTMVPYDVLFMDVQMPEMDGFQATRAIRVRELASDRRLPIIAMTAHAMKGDRERCLEAGMDGYVSKPIDLESLAMAVEAVFSRSRPPAAPVPALAAAQGCPGAAAVFDTQELAARTEGDVALMTAMIASFLAEVPGRRAELAAALAAADLDRLRRVGHTVKGSAGTLGAHALSLAGAGLEHAGRNGDLSGARSAAAALEIEVARLVPALSLAAGAVEGASVN